MTPGFQYEDIPLMVVSILAVVANVFVCFLVLQTHRLRTHTNKFVVSLAISDILIAGILLPFFFGSVNLTVTDYIGSITLLAGVGNICLVTVDRYIAVFHPFRYTTMMRKWFWAMIVIVWSLSIAISLVPLLWSTDQSTLTHQVYIFTVQIGLVILSYALIFLAYFKIFRKVRKTVRKERNLMMSLAVSQGNTKGVKVCPSSSESKVTRISIIIAANFMLTWLPVEYMTFVYNIGMPELIPGPLPKISLYTIALGALIDPVIYSYLKADFRHAIRRMCRKYIHLGQSGERSVTQSIMGYKLKESGYQSTDV